MTFYMIGKLTPNSPHFTRGLVKYVPGRSYFRAVLSQNGDKFATSPTPPIVERLTLTTLDAREKLCRVQRLFQHLSSTHPHSMKYIVLLLCAAKQNAILVLRGCTDPDSPRLERGV